MIIIPGYYIKWQTWDIAYCSLSESGSPWWENGTLQSAKYSVAESFLPFICGRGQNILHPDGSSHWPSFVLCSERWTSRIRPFSSFVASNTSFTSLINSSCKYLIRYAKQTIIFRSYKRTPPTWQLEVHLSLWHLVSHAWALQAPQSSRWYI